MQRKKLAFEQLTDIVGFRVVTDSEEDCYRALGIVHRNYPMVPGRFKDYISTPKPNGYRSLHTAVIGPEQRRIEIQIRTRDMHEEAEYGVAAHWLFKQAGDVRDDRQQQWLRPLLEILDKASGPEELLEHAKLEMFQDEVFCFSPRGAPDHAPARGRRRSISPTRCTRTWATPRWAPRSTGAWSRSGPSWRTAIRWRSCARKCRSRSPRGKASS